MRWGPIFWVWALGLIGGSGQPGRIFPHVLVPPSRVGAVWFRALSVLPVKFSRLVSWHFGTRGFVRIRGSVGILGILISSEPHWLPGTECGFEHLPRFRIRGAGFRGSGGVRRVLSVHLGPSSPRSLALIRALWNSSGLS